MCLVIWNAVVYFDVLVVQRVRDVESAEGEGHEDESHHEDGPPPRPNQRPRRYYYRRPPPPWFKRGPRRQVTTNLFSGHVFLSGSI